MAVVTKFPTANEIETTGWANPNNAHADDGVYATAAPGKNAGISTRYKTFGFDADIPSGATIDVVKIIYQYKVNTTASIATMRVRARISDVDEENHDDTSEPTADTTITVDITADRAWVRADLLDAALKITADGRRGNSNNAVTLSLDFIKVEVTYSTISATRGLISWTELETPLVPTRGQVSFTEFEAPIAPTRGLVSWTELEAPIAPTRGLVSWAEQEVPSVGVDPTRGLVAWSELETPLVPTRGLASWAELQVPPVATRGFIAWAQFEAPDVGSASKCRRIQICRGVWKFLGGNKQ